MTEAEVAWLAGLLEGEGSFGVHHPKTRKQAVVSMSLTDLDILERCVALAAGSITCHVADPPPNHKRAWRWRLYTRQARAVMEAVYPYMGERRQAQIRRVGQFDPLLNI